MTAKHTLLAPVIATMALVPGVRPTPQAHYRQADPSLARQARRSDCMSANLLHPNIEIADLQCGESMPLAFIPVALKNLGRDAEFPPAIDVTFADGTRWRTATQRLMDIYETLPHDGKGRVYVVPAKAGEPDIRSNEKEGIVLISTKAVENGDLTDISLMLKGRLPSPAGKQL